jgi:uncharacterized membrane protein HdeD (DUF308 family)
MSDDEGTPSTDDRRSFSSSRTTPEPLWRVMQAWSPVAAGVLRATVGIVMFAASLLTLPSTLATPFLTGVSLVMLIGGVASVMRHCRDDERLRAFGRYFPIVVAALAGAAVVATLVAGPGAFAPRLASPPPRADDGTIRFSP